MKRLKAIFSSIHTLGRTPDRAVMDAWERVKKNIAPAHSEHTIHSADDIHLIEQCIFGVVVEAAAYMKKQSDKPRE